MRVLPAFFSVPLLLACESAPPERDVFVPPYAEKGCWSRFYEQPGFTGAMRQLEGPSFVEAMRGSPVVVPDMEESGVQPLFSEVRSLVVGPRARLVGYAEPLFREQSLVLDPGTPVSDVAALGFRDKVASFRMACEAG